MEGNAGEAKSKSEVIADFITGFDLDAAPQELIGIAETAFVDTIGVMLAGSREPAARKVTEMIAAEGAAPAACVVGRGLRTSTQVAAGRSHRCGAARPDRRLHHRYRGLRRPCQMFPDTVERWRLAWHGRARHHLRGGRMCRPDPPAGGPDPPHHRHQRLHGVKRQHQFRDHDQTASWRAGRLGGAGFTANSGALEGPDGFFSSFAQGLAWNTDGFDSLGHEFALLDPGYKIKPFACGGLLHCGIEAALKLRDREKPVIGDISRIVIGVGPHAKKRAIDRYPWSEDSSRFCINYLVAYALIHGAPMVEAFTEVGYGDGAVRGLAERCETVLDDEFASLTGSVYSPGRVTIEMADGSHLEDAVYKPTGTRTTPLGETKIREKFDACATPVIGADRAAALYTTLSALSGQASLRDLWPMIAPGDGGSG
jgi:2-methylcitrate dehydratase PrpD